MNGAWVVFVKELRDALRDRRTLIAVVLSSVLMGPLVLLALSALVASSEQRAESREVLVAGLEHAPSLRNYRDHLQLLALWIHDLARLGVDRPRLDAWR